MNQSYRALGCVAALTAVLSSSLPVAALAAPRGLGSLVGMRQSEASDALRERGYRYAPDRDRDRDRREASWWNERNRQCVIVISGRGRVSDGVDAKPGDCGEKDKKDNTGKIVAGALIAGAVVAVAAASAEDARRKEEAERRGEYSPVKGVTCWRRERVCNDARGRSEAWTQYEFPAPASMPPRR
jgi:hypothetical protein